MADPYVDRNISVQVQPLLPEHREEGREERGSKAGVQDALNFNCHPRRAGPLQQSGNVTAKGGIADLADEDAESGDLFVWVLLQLGVGLDDERRGHCGE